MADVTRIAQKHGVSPGAVQALLDALRRGGGRQAQFSHPELGGMGQWSAGGMPQVGDMFNTALRDKVSALCRELAQEVTDAPASPGTQGHDSADWWPTGLGRPSAAGAQNGMRYACFPDSRRVAVEQGGTVTVYDSGDHRISGVSQQQDGSQALTFRSQHGTIGAADLPVARA